MEPAVEIVLDLAGGEKPHGSVRAPSRADLELAVTDVEIAGRAVRFRLTGLPRDASFEGDLAEDGKSIVGRLSHAAPAVPSTDIWLVEIDPAATPWKVIAATNATNRDGYDNQPQFTRDGRGFLFTSMRDEQADIYRYDLKQKTAVRLTETPDTSEYSPTPLPDSDGFSVVRVEEDGTQRVWAFDRDGGEPRLVIPDIRPVGYHAWLDPTTLALFVLGTPPTLQIASLPSGWGKTVAEDIGRSLRRSPDGGAVTYVHKLGKDDWRIEQIAVQGFEPAKEIARALPGNEDFTWLPDGRLLAADGSVLKTFRPGEDASWVPATDLSAHGIHGVTRLAAHDNGRLLAVVGERPAGPPGKPQVLPLTLTRVED